jgi:hypothetical protein
MAIAQVRAAADRVEGEAKEHRGGSWEEASS